ncbi:hypothetical protein F5Y06DRAFT_295559 [Hypoxylon sp. FL0890]|nr:hypothetical protein F5Y06DRAFT_295559 [Hypoxylon sp. FL0890]
MQIKDDNVVEEDFTEDEENKPRKRGRPKKKKPEIRMCEAPDDSNEVYQALMSIAQEGVGSEGAVCENPEIMVNEILSELKAEEKLRAKGRTPLPSRPRTQLAILPATSQNTEDVQPAQGQSSPQAREGLTCNVCGKVLKTASILRRHKRAVHLGTRCHWGDCTEEFNDTKALYKHLRDHQARAAVNDQQGELICHWPGCGKHQKEKREMRRHLRKHNTAA